MPYSAHSRGGVRGRGRAMGLPQSWNVPLPSRLSKYLLTIIKTLVLEFSTTLSQNLSVAR